MSNHRTTADTSDTPPPGTLGPRAARSASATRSVRAGRLVRSAADVPPDGTLDPGAARSAGPARATRSARAVRPARSVGGASATRSVPADCLVRSAGAAGPARPACSPRAARGARRSRGLGVVLALALALGAGCGSGGATDPTSAAAPVDAAPGDVETVAPAATADDGTTADDSGTLTVRADAELAVHADPSDPRPARLLPPTTEFGSALALLVTDVGEGDRAGWFEVLVPGRPNGATGWVRADAVTTHELSLEVHIDLAARSLEVRDGRRVVLSTPVGIGAPDHPTPPGRFSLTDKLETGQPDGPYGPYALGLSGRSEVLTEFAGGDGQVGIHGTDDPSSIGGDVSHGCIRVPNDVIATLSELLPLGTAVTVA